MHVKPRTATVVTNQPTQLLFISREVYQKELHSVLKAEEALKMDMLGNRGVLRVLKESPQVVRKLTRCR